MNKEPEHYLDFIHPPGDFGKKPQEEVLIFGKTPREVERALVFYDNLGRVPVEDARAALYAANATALREALKSIANFEDTEYDFDRPKIDQMLERAEFAVAKFSDPDVMLMFSNCLALLQLFGEFISLCAAHEDEMPEMIRREYKRFAGLVRDLAGEEK